MRPLQLDLGKITNPADSFTEAVKRVEALQTAEKALANLNQVCSTRLFTHGKQAGTVIVFLHGFTSCPDQFSQLGREFFERGFNVLIPRLPRHGLKDRLGNPLRGITAECLAEFASQSVDIARGLGERVIVAGLSGGGSMATWLFQVREDLNLSVAISPFLGVGFLPRSLNKPLANLALRIPDFFMWWDPINKVNNPHSSPYSYTRFPIHALFENLRLGYVARGAAEKGRPAADKILFITNENDHAVNNQVISDYEIMWKKYDEQLVESYQFPRELGLPHDLITAGRPDSKIEIVYPKLHELIQ